MQNVLNVIKSHIRDMRIDLITSSKNIKINSKKIYTKRIDRFFLPNRKLIRFVIKNGGVLSGSRALKCYSINGKSIIDRVSEDWDFIITESLAFKICSKFGIEYNLVDKVISVKKCMWYRHPSYAESYRIGAVDVQLIIKDEIPAYILSNNTKIANLSYCINSKIELMNELDLKLKSVTNLYDSSDLHEEFKKHQSDLTNIIIQYNS